MENDLYSSYFVYEEIIDFLVQPDIFRLLFPLKMYICTLKNSTL